MSALPLKTLRQKLLACFLLATVAPLGLTLWLASRLLEQSLAVAPVAELEASAALLESSGKALYANAKELLRERVAAGKLPREALEAHEQPIHSDQFQLEGNTLLLLRPDGKYRMPLSGLALADIQAGVAQSRATVEGHRERNLRRGFLLTLALSTTTIWLAALALLLYLTGRLTRPIVRLTEALRRFGKGQSVRLEAETQDEVGEAIHSFNGMAEEMARNREKLLLVTRLESWQALGRKMAHEVKNSLTPIRLTVEEMVARSSGQEKAFLEQAAQIVTEEVQTLERRVKAFSELASEPPLAIEPLDVRQVVEERLAFLRNAHPQVIYRRQWEQAAYGAAADQDLLKGILTNILENAADAVGRGGVVKVTLTSQGSWTEILIEDSGPGLSLLAQETLFQPTISFKRTGMGLGLSIAKRSALLMSGDVELVASSLGGAAFRIRLPLIVLPPTESKWQNESSSSTTKKTLAVRSA
ncbi:MAG: HAMP domain-containing sensor histidine kinase [Bryobacter sp.]|nr:HAMP domain-containing sensor histidine kinase [Bryobacter sp.]